MSWISHTHPPIKGWHSIVREIGIFDIIHFYPHIDTLKAPMPPSVMLCGMV